MGCPRCRGYIGGIKRSPMQRLIHPRNRRLLGLTVLFRKWRRKLHPPNRRQMRPIYRPRIPMPQARMRRWQQHRGLSRLTPDQGHITRARPAHPAVALVERRRTYSLKTNLDLSLDNDVKSSQPRHRGVYGLSATTRLCCITRGASDIVLRVVTGRKGIP